MLPSRAPLRFKPQCKDVYKRQPLPLSANYFGDLVKKETGKSAQEYIQLKVIDIAKERIFDPGR